MSESMLDMEGIKRLLDQARRQRDLNQAMVRQHEAWLEEWRAILARSEEEVMRLRECLAEMEGAGDGDRVS